MAKFYGLDILYTPRVLHQQVTAGSNLLITSFSNGKIRDFHPVPNHLQLKEGQEWKRFHYPLRNLNIPHINARLNSLHALSHLLAQFGTPTKSIYKSVKRLSFIWHQVKYKDMRKHVHQIRTKLLCSTGYIRNQDIDSYRLMSYPVRTGEMCPARGRTLDHYLSKQDEPISGGLFVPLWHKKSLWVKPRGCESRENPLASAKKLYFVKRS